MSSTTGKRSSFPKAVVASLPGIFHKQAIGRGGNRLASSESFRMHVWTEYAHFACLRGIHSLPTFQDYMVFPYHEHNRQRWRKDSQRLQHDGRGTGTDSPEPSSSRLQPQQQKPQQKSGTISGQNAAETTTWSMKITSTWGFTAGTNKGSHGENDNTQMYTRSIKQHTDK